MRRLPWVTFTIMAVCLLALLATNGSVGEAEQRGEAARTRLAEALARWIEQPYLRLDSRVVSKLEPSRRGEVQRLQELASLAPIELSPQDVSAEQAELDAQIAAALAELSAAEAAHPYLSYGLRPGSIGARTLLTHMFMHAGWLHLLGNLFLFFMAAPALEDRWGRPLFGAVYLTSGLASGLFFAALATDPNIPLVGASGAIAGVLGAFLVRLWSTKIRLWYCLFFGFRFFQGTFESPAWVMLPLWFGNELLQLWIKGLLGQSGGVANEAHIGGFLFGAAVALGIKAARLDERLESALEAKVTVQGNVAVAAALALREQGDLIGATQKLAALVKASPRDADAVDAYWDACVAQGCAGDAAHAVLALAQRELSANAGTSAAQRFVEVRGALPDYGFDAGFVARLVPHLRELDRELALGALRWLAQPQRGPLAPSLAQRVVDQAGELDALVAKQLARRLAQTDLPEAMRERFSALATALEAEAPDPAPSAHSGVELAGGEATPDWDHTARDFEADETAHESTPYRGPELTEPEPGLVEPEPELGESEPRSAPEIAPPGDDWDALKILDSDSLITPAPRFASLKVTEATPLALSEAGVALALDGGRKAQLAFAKIDAVALAAVRGLTAKPVLVIDLLLGWRSLASGELHCVRLRSDRFDPRKLASAPDPLAALLAFVAQLVERSGATPLAAADPARADALTPFADVATYEREVLEVGA